MPPPISLQAYCEYNDKMAGIGLAILWQFFALNCPNAILTSNALLTQLFRRGTRAAGYNASRHRYCRRQGFKSGFYGVDFGASGIPGMGQRKGRT